MDTEDIAELLGQKTINGNRSHPVRYLINVSEISKLNGSPSIFKSKIRYNVETIKYGGRTYFNSFI